MVNVDVEVDEVGEIVCRSERAEAAGEGVKAVVGEDFDDKSEIWCFRVRVLNSLEGIRVSVRGGEGEGGVEVRVTVEEEEEGREGDEEWKELSFGSHHHFCCLGFQRY